MSQGLLSKWNHRPHCQMPPHSPLPRRARHLSRSPRPQSHAARHGVSPHPEIPQTGAQAWYRHGTKRSPRRLSHISACRLLVCLPPRTRQAGQCRYWRGLSRCRRRSNTPRRAWRTRRIPRAPRPCTWHRMLRRHSHRLPYAIRATKRSRASRQISQHLQIKCATSRPSRGHRRRRRWQCHCMCHKHTKTSIDLYRHLGHRRRLTRWPHTRPSRRPAKCRAQRRLCAARVAVRIAAQYTATRM